MTAVDLNLICQAIIDGRRAGRALSNWVRQFELSETEFLVIWCLRDAMSADIDQRTIAERLSLSPAQVSATVERLRADGRIVQQPAAGDRRRRQWQLSSNGRALLTTMLRNQHGLSEHEAAA